MDSSSSCCSSHNWLAFSLPNNTPTQLHDSSHLSLFEAFNTNPGVDERRVEQNGICPKLEDFLGGCGGQFSSEETLSTISETELYDSELKSIAASFLRGFSGEQADPQKPVMVSEPPEQPPKKAIDTFGQRTSIYRGVTRHRWTGRYEAHLWDNSCRREGQSRKGRQGGYDKEERAARAYDLAALKYWGPTTTTNFPVSNYEKELVEMKNMTRQEFVASLRRKSSGFSRGASIYRGVTRHHQHGRWQARIGRVAGNKDLYLGTFSTQEEAAEAYDIAAIKFRGLNAVTNFDMSRYDVKSIANSNLPIGGMTTKSKTSETLYDNKSNDATGSDDRDPLSSASSITFVSHSHSHSQPQPTTTPTNLTFALPIKPDPTDYWSLLGYQNPSNLQNVGKSPIRFQLPFNMDSCLNGVTNNNNNALVFNGGGLFNQQNTATSSVSVPTVGLSGNEGTSSWIAPSLHSFQTARPNLSVFQTPIFGME
ncbi:AP2/ERF domain [Dillenia turbinata]|uniref:AP2/ERF domain n=1 Tax=Dillenia turbinata TaxID=194707 RepID=A0AAN8ZNT0_9MAGN